MMHTEGRDAGYFFFCYVFFFFYTCAPPQQMADVPNAAPVACVLAGHGLFLLGCGWYGAKISGWTAMHSLYAGAGGGAALQLV